MPHMHVVEPVWRESRAIALDATGRAVSDLLDHLSDVEQALGDAYPKVTEAGRGYAALLRSAFGELASEARKLRSDETKP